MLLHDPLFISRQLLTVLGTRLFAYHQDRVPQSSAILVVSNHRSFMDAPLLMAAINRPIRFACHHYMGQVPLMREVVTRMGCFPLDAPQQRQQAFFDQATRLLQTKQAVGVFPEGAQPMIQVTAAEKLGEFHRGFAHLALRAPIQELAVLPVAIASYEESTNSAVPLKLLSWFDPSEPLFDQDGWHPMVVYQRVHILVGRPLWITASQRQSYQGKQARTVVADLTAHCHSEISSLLSQGY
ncbi:1-acyl-sn-glycerol-3-phosphate acyltransferase [Leptolyngbya sp. FACHB-671]|uniref:lysophospholipid acyltransferase family protein n=1 Tax=unclassified Leptolyngbya TaxID=2650499 RepID=UPI00168479CC|nr:MULTISPECIES: lysophospholipid acyltransferase family protein [unclassified Leptolyngbya]MBD1998679.1 1-acyl-sn-glycerol-3-phosphate acyltransferase [Leptolyngbya sp. FACHB-541]MBD2071728.1 1-acyl-sn-glycerol-3-phosphate acyltransferase [Leptolyngbya sp. FACHB-671]